MEIKYKLYTYPVLSGYSDDYKSGQFDVSIDISRDGYDLKISFQATLTCQSLLDLIQNEKAKYVYHLECYHVDSYITIFRKNFQSVIEKPFVIRVHEDEKVALGLTDAGIACP